MSANGHSPDRDDARVSDLAVLEANEYKNKRRLERILDAMDSIPDQADAAKERFVAGEIDMHARRIMVQDAVNDAIWEAWNLLVDHERNCQQKASENVDSDDAGADVWPHSEYLIGHPDKEPIGIIEQEHNEDIVVWGLQEFHRELDELWTETWTEQVKPRNGRAKSVRREVTHSVPMELSWAAALRLKEFLNSEHDLEIQFEEMDDALPNWSYDELKEVPDGVEVI